MKFDDFYTNVQSQYPGTPLTAIREAYKSKFDRDPVFESGPSLDDFASNVRTRYPATPDDKIETAYKDAYGDGLLREAKRSTLRGLGQLAGNVGSMVDILQTPQAQLAMGSIPGIGGIVRAAAAAPEGEKIRDYWKERVAEVPKSRAAQGDVMDDPMGTLSNPSWWAAGLPETLTSQLPVIAGFGLGGPVGAGFAGGALEGLSTYGTAKDEGLDNPELRGLAMGGAASVLNALPFLGNTGGAVRRTLVGMAKEGITEGAEEIPGAFLESPANQWGMGTLQEGLRNAANVAPLAAVTGIGNVMAQPVQDAPARTSDLADITAGLREDAQAETGQPQAETEQAAPPVYRPFEGETQVKLPKAEIQRQAVTKMVADIAGKWQGGPMVEVKQSYRDLPDDIRKQFDDGIEAVYDGQQKVYMLADKMKSPADVQRVLFHEALGHFSIEQVIPDFGKFSADVLTLAPKDPTLRGIFQGVQRDYASEPEIIQAAETVARYAEKYPNTKHPIIERMYAQIREWARRAGFNLDLNRADLNRALRKAMRHLEQGTGAVTASTGTGEAKAAKLDMSREARMQRAAEQGFSVDAFKGSYPYDPETGPAYGFKNGKWQQVENIGAEPDEITFFQSKGLPHRKDYVAGEGGHAGFFSSDPDVANRFANAYDGGAVYPVKIRLNNPLVIDGSGKTAGSFQFQGIAERNGTLSEYESVKKAFSEKKHDGVIIENTLDEGTVYVPFKSSDVRSVNAAFDPAETDSPRLLASRPTNQPVPMTFDERVRQSIVRETDFSPQVLDAYSRVASMQEHRIEKQRRGVQTWGDTEKKAAELLASDLGYQHVNQMVAAAPGATANAEDMVIIAGAIHEATQRVEAASEAVSTDRSPANLAKLKATLDRLAYLQAPWMGYRAEAGRALQILRKTAPIMENVNQLLDAYTHDQKSLETVAEKIQANKKAREAGNKAKATGAIVRTEYTPTSFDKLMEWFYNSILSGPATHEVNILGNAAFMATEEIAKQVGLRMTGQSAAAAQRLKALSLGVQTGLRNAKEAFRTELPQLDQQTKVEIDPVKRAAIQGTKGKIIRTPGRLLQAEDEFFKGIAYTMELSQLATQEAGGDLQAAQQIMANPTPEMMRQAVEAARRTTFTNKLGPYMSAVNHALNKSKVGKLIVPFVQTPTNITKRAMDYSPLGLLGLGLDTELANDLKGRNGKEKQAIAMTRQAIGGALGMVVLQAAAAGLITGGGPADPREKALWRQRDGRDQYSVKIGDQWVSYLRFDPLAIPMGILADLYEVAGVATEGDIGKVALTVMNSFMNNMANKTWLSGVSSFVEAMNDPMRYGENWVAQMATGMMVPNIIGQTTGYNDPYVREARGIVDRLKSRLPGKREELAKRITLSGEYMQSQGTTVAGVPTPLRMSQAKEVDPVADAMLRNGVNKGMPSRSMMGVEMTGDEYEKWAQMVQGARYKALMPIVTSPGFNTLPPVMQATQIEKVWDAMGSQAGMRAMFLFQHPDLLDRIKTARVEKMRPAA